MHRDDWAFIAGLGGTILALAIGIALGLGMRQAPAPCVKAANDDAVIAFDLRGAQK